MILDYQMHPSLIQTSHRYFKLLYFEFVCVTILKYFEMAFFTSFPKIYGHGEL